MAPKQAPGGRRRRQERFPTRSLPLPNKESGAAGAAKAPPALRSRGVSETEPVPGPILTAKPRAVFVSLRCPCPRDGPRPDLSQAGLSPCMERADSLPDLLTLTLLGDLQAEAGPPPGSGPPGWGRGGYR